MALLKYKTRGMTDPAKKEKVYFCCHPDELDYFFEGISNEILERQNCAVWYRDESEPYSEEEHLHDLSRMQLFVMPVTTRLLNTKNRALDVEFRFAVENRIPVLPLMQEAGLDALFNEKCGDLQYLDKQSRDDTAISYEEKLTKFLEGVLVGDELAEKIRNAFDAYVFLSYRKKDRKYAQELMRLIHKNDFCRDIAIWYDEFLTPGENFNDSIKDALEKSGLFVLAVTPNLVNEENYIMTTEYPLAKREQKPILPAELVPTDRGLLREKYEDIPDCTDARNSVALSDALLESVQRMAIKENDDSPEHNFFIGLAYLSGIDVEVDHERALGLISSAADAGLSEAQKKLVSMYMSGDGVERSFENAVIWERRLADSYGEVFKSEGTWESLDEWLACLVRVAGKYSLIHRYGDALDTCLYLAELCDGIAHLTADDILTDNTRIRYSSKAYMYAALYCRNIGDLGRGTEYAKKSLDIIEPLYNAGYEQGSLWVKKDYAESLSYMGEIYRLTNDIDTALSYFTGALEIKKELFDINRTMKISAIDTEYARSLATVAGVHLLKFENDKATEYYLKAISLLEVIEEENGTWETVPLLVDISLTFSAIYRVAGRFAEMDELFSGVIESIENYRNATGVMLYYSAYRARVSLGQSYAMQRRYEEAFRELDKADAVNDEYFAVCQRDIDVPHACTVYSLRATMSVELGDYVGARRAIERAAVYADECLESGLDIHSADCAGVYSMYSSIELMDENVEKALVYLKKAISILEENDFSFEDTRALPMFVIAHMNYAVLSFDNGDLEGAREYGSKCIAAYEKYRSMAPGVAERSNMTYVYYVTAKAKYHFDKKEGREYLLEKCRYLEDRVEKGGLLIDYDSLATVYLALSGVSGIFERSKWNKKAVKLIEFMEDNFAEEFEKTIVYILLNNE